MARLNKTITHYLNEYKQCIDCYDEFKPLKVSVHRCQKGQDLYHVDFQNTTDGYTKSKEVAYFMTEGQLIHYLQGIMDALHHLTIYSDYFKPNYLSN